MISDKNFAYNFGSETVYGGFDSSFVFDWDIVPERENIRRNFDWSLPMRAPTMAGGLFTIDREYFYELGSYDDGMDIWGAENIEISLRVETNKLFIREILSIIILENFLL